MLVTAYTFLKCVQILKLRSHSLKNFIGIFYSFNFLLQNNTASKGPLNPKQLINTPLSASASTGRTHMPFCLIFYVMGKGEFR